MFLTFINQTLIIWPNYRLFEDVELAFDSSIMSKISAPTRTTAAVKFHSGCAVFKDLSFTALAPNFMVQLRTKTKVKSMKVMSLKRLDTALTRILDFLIVPKIRTDRLEDEILVIRPGGMGDLVLLQIALEKHIVDFNKITFVIEKRSEPWAKQQNLNYLCYDRDFLKIIRLKKFRKVFCSEQFFGLAGHLARFLVSKNGKLWGFETCKSSRHFSDVASYAEDAHEVSNFVSLLSKGLSLAANVVKERQESPRMTGPYQVIILGGLESTSRALNLEGWLTLIRSHGHSKQMFKMVASPKDLAFAKSLASELKVHEISNSFQHAIELICGAESVIGVDSGLVHVSSYFDVPATVLFTSGNQTKWTPLAKGSVILSNLFDCQPCAKFGQVPFCNFNFRCKKNLNELKILSVN